MRRPAVHGFVFVIPALFALVLVAGYWGHVSFTRAGPLQSDRVVVIEKGVGLDGIGRTLEQAGVISDRLLFKFGSRLTGRGRSMRAGEYQFDAGISMDAAVAQLVEGRTVKRRVTIAEGLTVRQIYALIEQADGLTGKLPPQPGEGLLLPETYFYALGDSRSDLVTRMKAAMDHLVEAQWQSRGENLLVSTPEEALVLSSIIERETGLDSERARVSAVFHNRLRRGMRLQSDPTVAFAVTGGKTVLDRPLLRSELEIDSPYNTYKVSGLPPAPIASPGAASIKAALHPLQTRELYFVANGDGGHTFARTLTEHNRNVRKWRRIERQRRRATGH